MNSLFNEDHDGRDESRQSSKNNEGTGGLLIFKVPFFAYFHEISMIARFILTCLLSYLSQILTS